MTTSTLRMVCLVGLVGCGLWWCATLNYGTARGHLAAAATPAVQATTQLAISSTTSTATVAIPEPTMVPTSTAQEVAPAHPSPSTVDHLQISSATLGDVRDINVYLPPGYLSPDQMNRRYPVLYLLHGAPGSYGDWVENTDLQATADRLIAAGALPPIIIIMPDGNYGAEGDSQWVNGNSDAGFGPVEDFVVNELIPGIDGRYRTIADRQHRSVGGLSAGAYGAWNLIMRYPTLFSVVLAHSGFYRAQPTDDGTDLFAGDVAAQHANSPIEHLDDSPLLRETGIYIDVGSDDPWFVAGSEELDRALSARHIDHAFHEFPGAHSWDYWSTHLVDSLSFLGAWLQKNG